MPISSLRPGHRKHLQRLATATNGEARVFLAASVQAIEVRYLEHTLVRCNPGHGHSASFPFHHVLGLIPSVRHLSPLCKPLGQAAPWKKIKCGSVPGQALWTEL